MNLTTLLGLGKPLPGENYDIAVPNNNMDLIDAAVAADRARLTAIEGDVPPTFPRCKIIANATQAFANNTPGILDLAAGNIDYDTNAMADIANDKIIIKTAGLYIITAKAVWAANATGTRFNIIYKNGTTAIAEHRHAATPGSNYKTVLSTEPMPFAVNDYVQLQLSQSSGGSLSTADSDGLPYIAAVWYAGL
jgi:hypothetical protein